MTPLTSWVSQSWIRAKVASVACCAARLAPSSACSAVDTRTYSKASGRGRVGVVGRSRRRVAGTAPVTLSALRKAHGMRKARVFGQVFSVQGMVIEDVTVPTDADGDEEILVVSVRPDAGASRRLRRPGMRYGYGYGSGGHRHHLDVPAGGGAAGAVPGAEGTLPTRVDGSGSPRSHDMPASVLTASTSGPSRGVRRPAVPCIDLGFYSIVSQNMTMLGVQVPPRTRAI